jgi:hypothetical protein
VTRLLVLALVAAPAVAAADPMTPRTSVGWSFGIGYVRTAPPPMDADAGEALSLHVGRGSHGIEWRAEATAIALPASSLSATGAAVARWPLLHTVRCGFKCDGFGLYVDAGVGILWRSDDDARARGFGTAGLSFGWSLSGDDEPPPWHPWLQMSFGARLVALDHGWGAIGGLELSWMRD